MRRFVLHMNNLCHFSHAASYHGPNRCAYSGKPCDGDLVNRPRICELMTLEDYLKNDILTAGITKKPIEDNE